MACLSPAFGAAVELAACPESTDPRFGGRYLGEKNKNKNNKIRKYQNGKLDLADGNLTSQNIKK